MKQVVIRDGVGKVVEVPRPQIQAGRILVKNYYSCISPGTEMDSISNTAKPLWKRAVENPAEVQKVLAAVSNQGIQKTREVVKSKLDSGNEVGYSSAGIVVEVAEAITAFKVGDHVACAGTGFAKHADIVSIPKNLAVKIPDTQDLVYASTVAIGSIALQGVRRASPQIGENFVVIGLGLLGQITAQLLKNNGCKVLGTDLDPERGIIAEIHGLDYFINNSEEDVVKKVLNICDGIGADGVIITAASSSNQIVSDAFKMTRKKGRVVLVGAVGLDLKREDFYQDEIDFLISTSYGPGRYDEKYELGGIDYPLGYVRWTENRNMQVYLELLNSKKLNLDKIINDIYEIDNAGKAYKKLESVTRKPLAFLLKYSLEFQKNDSLYLNTLPKHNIKSTSNKVALSLVGAGGFAKGVHLPNIKKLNKVFSLHSIIDNSGNNAASTARQYHADSFSTKIDDALSSSKVDAILIATRHNTHGSLVLKALKAGKHVFVEKPLTLNRSDLRKLEKLFSSKQSEGQILLTGFNRRFSKYFEYIKSQVDKRINPLLINYRMNAGYQPLDTWYHSDIGGGRNLGEACHIYDLFTYLTGAKAVDTKVAKIAPATKYFSGSDNFIATTTFDDGSIATLTYTALGNNNFPKETMELYFDGQVIHLNDYRMMKQYGKNTKVIKSRTPEKGHYEELKLFANAILKTGSWPIPLWEQIQAMEIAFEVEDQLRNG
ncbi:MAG: Gfo/Idh/MocA family oxidoreductase [Mariniphaga sp.]|nr:Gfo/Idh/MocA family oxidoreductase [Mariniphaga sp.]